MESKQLMLRIADRNALHSHYMPFIKDGGIFVPCDEQMELHQEVTVHMLLEDAKKKILIPGFVVWLSPKNGSRGSGVCGIGIRFTGAQRDKVKRYIETLLGVMLAKYPSNPVY